MFGRLVRTGLVTAALLCAGPALAQEHGHDQHEPTHEHAAGAGEHQHTAGDEHESGHGEAHGGEELNVADMNYKEAHKNPPLLLALINFGLLLALLGWKAVPAMRRYWTNKSEMIRGGLEEGTRLREEAEAKLEEYDKRIKDVDAEVDALVEDIRAEADAEKKRILEEAEAQAEATRKAADARIAAEIAAARIAIEREVAAAAIAAAESILRDKVGPNDHQELVSSFISSLGESPSTTSGRPS